MSPFANDPEVASFCQTVKLTPFGHYELTEKPSADELSRYYNEKYYQQSSRNYEKTYSDDELTAKAQKHQDRLALLQQVVTTPPAQTSMLDVGAGEGFALAAFAKSGFQVTGIDYSDFGCQQHNPDLLKHLIVGDIQRSLANFDDHQFDIIILDNVLEHVLHPEQTLVALNRILKPNGALLIEVPNDFSLTQYHAAKAGKITAPFWVVSPDHISYFNKESLAKLGEAAQFQVAACLGDFPIDWALFNDQTNYVAEKSLGRTVHQARLRTEAMLAEVPQQSRLNYYASLGEMGLGRNLTMLFSINQQG